MAKYNKKDFEFMNSLGSAVLAQSPRKISLVVIFWFVSVIAFIVWASYAQIDEITRGTAKVIPFSSNQVLQNLEGGIVKEILVEEGETIKKGDIIVKLSNSKSSTSLRVNSLKYLELKAKSIRLRSQVNKVGFPTLRVKNVDYKEYLLQQKIIFYTKIDSRNAQDQKLASQIEQKKLELAELKVKVKHLKRGYYLIKEEVKMTKPMVKEGVRSRVDYLKLQREANNISKDLFSAKLSLPKYLALITEFRQLRKERSFDFIGKSKEELYDVESEMKRLKASTLALSDQVTRTNIRSSVSGVVQKLHVHTIGGVINPGEPIVEIVPNDSLLYLEVKIKPSDIAFIHPGIECVVKFSAYDFAIYGGLVGHVTQISPDTMTDEKGDTYYLIHVVTNKRHLGNDENPLEIIAGMTANVDILTGKKSIMQYILKPIVKSREYVFTER